MEKTNPPATGEAPGLSVGLHWLTATTTVLPPDGVLGYISEQVGGGFEVLEHGGFRGYTAAVEGLYGLRVCWNPARSEMGTLLLLDGSACEQLSIMDIRSIYLGCDFRASRLDIAIDGCAFAPGVLEREWVRDNVNTRCKRPDPTKKAVRAGREHIRTCRWYEDEAGNTTFYMGSRSSTQFGRCYDERGWTRFELELKDQRAARAAVLVFDNPEQLARVGLSLVRDFVDFVDASISDVHRDRCPLLPFWAEFVQDMEKASVRLDAQPEQTRERVIAWVESQVAKTLAMYELFTSTLDNNQDARYRLYKMGLERLGAADRQLLRSNGVDVDHVLARFEAVKRVAAYS